MAGIFYLPRLYVYHCEEEFKTVSYDKFCLMEKRLLKVIMNPAIIGTWLFGILMVANNHLLIQEMWFLIKLLLVLLMSGFHGYLSVCRKNFVLNKNERSARHFKFVNEVPTLLLILIIFMVVFKPSF